MYDPTQSPTSPEEKRARLESDYNVTVADLHEKDNDKSDDVIVVENMNDHDDQVVVEIGKDDEHDMKDDGEKGVDGGKVEEGGGDENDVKFVRGDDDKDVHNIEDDENVIHDDDGDDDQKMVIEDYSKTRGYVDHTEEQSTAVNISLEEKHLVTRMSRLSRNITEIVCHDSGVPASACASVLTSPSSSLLCCSPLGAREVVACAAVLAESSLAARDISKNQSTTKTSVIERLELYHELCSMCASTEQHEAVQESFSSWVSSIKDRHGVLWDVPASYCLCMLIVTYARLCHKKMISLQWMHDGCIVPLMTCKLTSILPNYDKATLAHITLSCFGICQQLYQQKAPALRHDCLHLLDFTMKDWQFFDRIGYSNVVEELYVAGFSHKVRVINNVDSTQFPKDFEWIGSCRFRNQELQAQLHDESFIVGCGCNKQHSCTDVASGCACVGESLRFRGNVSAANPEEFLVPNMLLYECNDKCLCGLDCPNRVTQRDVPYPLEIFKTSNGRGWGVRLSPESTAPIPRFSYVGEYIGEIMTSRESRDFFDLHGEHGELLTYQYILDIDRNDDDDDDNEDDDEDDGQFDSREILKSDGEKKTPENETYVIDARWCGSLSRFFNHSCEPNLFCVFFWVNHWMRSLPRIGFFTKSQIMPGEELVFDYHMKGSFIPCLCGSAKCRGFL